MMAEYTLMPYDEERAALAAENKEREKAFRYGVTVEQMREMMGDGEWEIFIGMFSFRFPSENKPSGRRSRKSQIRNSLFHGAPKAASNDDKIRREFIERRKAMGTIFPGWPWRMNDSRRTESQWREITLWANQVYLDNIIDFK
jgi:hypothetical protein